MHKTINERALSGAALEELLAALLDELRELDEDLKAFKLLSSPFCEGYTQAGNGGKSGKEEPAISAPVSPPSPIPVRCFLPGAAATAAARWAW